MSKTCRRTKNLLRASSKICRWRNFVEKIIIVENSNNLNYVDGDTMSMNIKNYNRILFCFLKLSLPQLLKQDNYFQCSTVKTI